MGGGRFSDMKALDTIVSDAALVTKQPVKEKSTRKIDRMLALLSSRIAANTEVHLLPGSLNMPSRKISMAIFCSSTSSQAATMQAGTETPRILQG